MGETHMRWKPVNEWRKPFNKDELERQNIMCKEEKHVEIDYNNDNLEIIRKEEIARLLELSDDLEKETRLCSKVGRDVVLEFKFKGELQDVKRQLIKLIMRYRNDPFTENTRGEVMQGIRNVNDYRDEKNEDGYRQMLKKAIKTADFTQMQHLCDKTEKRILELHKRKECICYTNVEENHD